MAKPKTFVAYNLYDKEYYLVMDKHSVLAKIAKFLYRSKLGTKFWTFMVFVLCSVAEATGFYRTGFIDDFAD